MKSQFEAMSRYEHVNEKRLSENIIEQVGLGKVNARCNMVAIFSHPGEEIPSSLQEFDNCQLRVPESVPPMHNYNKQEPGIITVSYVFRFTATPGIEVEIPLIVTSMAYKNGGKATAGLSGRRHRGGGEGDENPIFEHDPGSVVYLC
jgi:hypothetical protein